MIVTAASGWITPGNACLHQSDAWRAARTVATGHSSGDSQRVFSIDFVSGYSDEFQVAQPVYSDCDSCQWMDNACLHHSGAKAPGGGPGQLPQDTLVVINIKSPCQLQMDGTQVMMWLSTSFSY